MPQDAAQSPPPLPVAAVPVGVPLEYASSPRIARGIAWQRSARNLHLGFESPRHSTTGSLVTAGGVMLLGLFLVAVLVGFGMLSAPRDDENIALATFIGVTALAIPAVGFAVFHNLQRHHPVARPVELDVSPEGLSLFVPARSPAPLVWPAGRLREIRCNAVPGSFCIEVFPADSPPEEHWFDIAGELAPEVFEIELRQILRLGEASAPANPAAPLSYATPVLPAEQRSTWIPWIRRTDYLLVLLPPPVSVPLNGCIMGLGAIGGIIAFFYILGSVLNLPEPTVPVVCLFAGTTLIGLLVAILIGRRSRTTPAHRDRATLVMACPDKLWLHVRSEKSAPESFDAARIKSLTVNAHPSGLWLRLQYDDARVNRFLPTCARAAGAALCDDLQRILRVCPILSL